MLKLKVVEDKLNAAIEHATRLRDEATERKNRFANYIAQNDKPTVEDKVNYAKEYANEIAYHYFVSKVGYILEELKKEDEKW